MDTNTSKPIVLFVTQTLGDKAACGIGMMGALVSSVLVESKKYDFKIVYTDDFDPVKLNFEAFKPVAIIYNYAIGTTPWVDSAPRHELNVPQFKIHHDMHQALLDSFTPEAFGGFEYLIADDPTLIESERVFLTPRLMPPYPHTPIQENEIPVIGFQGFGPIHKGIHRIAEQVQREFDEAIIRLHIPFGYYGDPQGHDARRRVQECVDIIHKSGITIKATHELLSPAEVVQLLSENTINCYFYDYLGGCGLASSPDFALAAGRPIAVTKSHQLRNFWDLPVCIEDHSLKEIIAVGTEPLKPLYEAYSKENVILAYERIINKVTGI